MSSRVMLSATIAGLLFSLACGNAFRGTSPVVKDCTADSDRILCKLLAVWNSEEQPVRRRETFAQLVAGQAPAVQSGPIARCLSVSRAYDRGAATKALHDCLVGIEPDLSANGSLGGLTLDEALGLSGRLRPVEPKVGAARACGGSAQVNPYLAQKSQPWDFANWPHSSVAPPDDTGHRETYKDSPEYRRLEREATQKWQQYAEALEREASIDHEKSEGRATQEELDAAKAETKKVLQEANEAIEERDSFVPAVVDANDGVVPPDDGTAVAQPAEGFEESCTQLNQFLANCAASGWNTSPCKLFLDGVKGCKSTIMLVDPEQGTGCAEAPATIGTDAFDRVMSSVYWSRARPAGPDEDPCAPRSRDGAFVMVLQPNPCTDPQARVDPASGTCVAPFTDPGKQTDILLGRATLSDIVDTLEKLCGCSLEIDVPRGGNPRAQPAYQVVAWSAEPAYRPIP